MSGARKEGPDKPSAGASAVGLVLRLGDRTYDLSTRAIVAGILNRTPDSFFDHGATFELDSLLARAAEHVEAGADILEVGGVKAGIGAEVTLAEELDRVIPAVAALVDRFGVPVAVDTWRGTVIREAMAAGAVLANDISGFADPEYLPAVAQAGGSVVATHIRLRPREYDPNPVYDDVVSEVEAFLAGCIDMAERAGIPRDRIVIDPGLDLGKNAEQSLALLGSSGEFTSLGQPLFLAASNKDFLGETLSLAVNERRDATMAALSIGIMLGCRVLRVHDVSGACRVRNTIAALLAGRPAVPAQSLSLSPAGW